MYSTLRRNRRLADRVRTLEKKYGMHIDGQRHGFVVNGKYVGSSICSMESVDRSLRKTMEGVLQSWGGRGGAWKKPGAVTKLSEPGLNRRVYETYRRARERFKQEIAEHREMQQLYDQFAPYLNRERLSESDGERVALMLDSCTRDERETLRDLFGEKKLGGYADV